MILLSHLSVSVIIRHICQCKAEPLVYDFICNVSS